MNGDASLSASAFLLPSPSTSTTVQPSFSLLFSSLFSSPPPSPSSPSPFTHPPSRTTPPRPCPRLLDLAGSGQPVGMSFNFDWSKAFSPSFLDSAKNILETALNKGNTPALIVGKIEVRELDMGVIVSATQGKRKEHTSSPLLLAYLRFSFSLVLRPFSHV